jgi:hypothetical protein
LNPERAEGALNAAKRLTQNRSKHSWVNFSALDGAPQRMQAALIPLPGAQQGAQARTLSGEIGISF